MNKQLAALAVAEDAYYAAKAEDAEIRVVQASWNCTYAQARHIYFGK